MARRKDPLWLIWQRNDNHVSKAIHREFELYAKDTGFYPTQNALFGLMTQGQWITPQKYQAPRYEITQGQFDYWFDRLVAEGYIAIDDRTRAISSTGLEIKEKDRRSPDLE